MHELRQEKDNLSSLKWRTTPSWHTLFNSYNYGPFLMLCNYANATIQKKYVSRTFYNLQMVPKLWLLWLLIGDFGYY